MDINASDVAPWFETLRNWLEPSYLAATEPWRQSGFSGPVERWEACRRPIAECIHTSGTFLDIGCANGYLLQSLIAWTGERGIEITPYGLDLSDSVLALAAERLPQWTANLFAGNSLTWRPSRRFDYVRTELCYVPGTLQHHYVTRLLNEFLTDDGKLLVAEYRSRSAQPTPWVDQDLCAGGFAVESVVSGSWEGLELTRVAVVSRM